MVKGVEGKQGLRFLIIDDDDFMLKRAETILGRANFERIETANDGQVALNKIQRGEWFDLILLDLDMPHMDGIEVMRNLAAMSYSGTLALFSGEDIRVLKTAESLASALNLNVVGTLTKPLSLDSINLLIESIEPHKKIVELPLELVGEDELREAISLNQIIPYFQPKVRAKDKSVASAEVLARWIHPKKGVMMPIAFIPAIEKFGLSSLLTASIFNQSLSFFGSWLKSGYKFTLGINLCADELSNVDFPEIFGNLVKANYVPPKNIEFEVPETQLIENITKSLDVLTRLKLKGFGLSIDDFGTGTTSITQLTEIPFTELKIDRTFVHGAYKNPAAHSILELSATLGKKLNMEVVAEGVEDEADWDSAVAAGCDLIQGYYIAKPMPAADFEQWLTTNKN